MRIALLTLSLSLSSLTAIDEDLLQSAGMKELLASLVARSGYGRFDVESAAFLRRLPDGTFLADPWPFQRGFRKASFTGKVPDDVVAIVHTHPRQNPRPSLRDQELAMRLAIPIVVLTPESIIVVEADGTVRTVVDRFWLSRYKKTGVRVQPRHSSIRLAIRPVHPV